MSSSISSSDSNKFPKTILFVRHAESAYNAFKFSPINWLTLRALRDPMIFDPPLSPKGVKQLIQLGDLMEHHKILEKAEIIIASPLIRAIDTAMAVMGKKFNPALNKKQAEKDKKIAAEAKKVTETAATSETSQQQTQQPPPAAADSMDSASSTILSSSHFPVPILISPLCTEILDTSADIGSSPAELVKNYPLIDFSELKESWWYYEGENPRSITDEPKQKVAERVKQFKEFIAARPETFLVIVTHSSFIKHCTGAKTKIPNCAVQECEMENSSNEWKIKVKKTRLTIS